MIQLRPENQVPNPLAGASSDNAVSIPVASANRADEPLYTLTVNADRQLCTYVSLELQG
ncbi:MAG: hypothetical protein M3Y72_18450 [Acidobacteriota bacterium]|nr:hypothetical protein [Acidobacteriota bacterium]